MSKETVKDHFGKTAANYASAQIHARGEDLGWLVEAANLKGDERLLDCGTGAGHVVFAFAPHVAFAEGIDITPPMLAEAETGATERNLTNVAFSRGDVEAIPREDASYDVVVSRWCAHHYMDIRLAVSEIARVLKPGGTFLLVDAYSPANKRLDTTINTLEILRDTAHVRDYSIAEWLEFCETVGLHGEVIKEWGLRLDGDNWVQRIGTPSILVDAIRYLLAKLDDDVRSGISVTGDDSEAGWGFNLPSCLIRASKIG